MSQSSILCDVFLIAYILAHKKYYVKKQKYGIKYLYSTKFFSFFRYYRA